MPIIRYPLDEDEVLAILRTPEMHSFLGGSDVEDRSVSRLSEKAFQITNSSEYYIIRFPPNEDELRRLKKEALVQMTLKDRVQLQIPAAQVLGIEGFPTFAIHQLIPGQPLTSEIYDCLSAEARDRLISDLANFFYETHCIPLEIACEWLGIQKDEDRLTTAYGKPGWFGGEASPAIRASLVSVLDTAEMELFDEVVTLFDALPLEPGDLVFGHGDLHGYNMAIGEDDLGPKLIGVFDLGCTGILDIHEDFFRLSLVSEDLLERVIETYQDLASQKRTLRRDRIAIYYRAFLFYLMGEMSGEDLTHLKGLLKKHLEYHHAKNGSTSKERKISQAGW
jgi:aminoglycoside phosphotransferase (APT) family kinase protein